MGGVILGAPDYDQVIACAIAARAGVIISSDRHQRNIESHQDIRIASTGEALRLVTQRGVIGDKPRFPTQR